MRLYSAWRPCPGATASRLARPGTRLHLSRPISFSRGVYATGEENTTLAQLYAGNKAPAKARVPVLPESAWNRTLIDGPAKSSKVQNAASSVSSNSTTKLVSSSESISSAKQRASQTRREYPPINPLPDPVMYDQPAIPNPGQTAEAHRTFWKRTTLGSKLILGLAFVGGGMYLLVPDLHLDAPDQRALPPIDTENETELITRLTQSNELLSSEELDRLITVELRKYKAQEARSKEESREPNKASYVLLSIKRSSIIAKAVVASMWDYRRTLNAKYSDDDLRRDGLRRCHTRSAKRVLRALQANGGIYIKLGQHVSATLFIPQEWRDVLTPLQDQNQPTPLKELEVTFQAETSKSFDDAFSWIDPKPIGVASLAQVHRAVERETGREVAIKMMHPDVERFSVIDIATVNRLTALVKRTFPSFEFTWLAEEMNQNLPLEMDFAHETGNAEHARMDFSRYRSTPVYIPEVYFASKRVMVMEFIHGRRPDDLEYLRDHNINRNHVSQELSTAFAQMLYVHGFFHADPHAGNVLIRAVPPGSERAKATRSKYNFELVLLDHGLYFHIPQSLRADYARFWLSLLSHGTPAVQRQRRELAKRVGNIGDDLYPILESAITGRSGLEGSDPKNPHGVGGKRRPGSLLDMDGGTNMTRAEKEHIQRTVMEREGLFEDVLRMLRVMPRQMLMVLKLNDLTRSLDMNLHTTHGPIRPFIISARYCAMCVWDDDWRKLQAVRKTEGWGLSWTKRVIGAWYSYAYFNYGFRLIEVYSDTRARVSIMGLYLRTVFSRGFTAASRAAAGIEEEEASRQEKQAEAQASESNVVLEAEQASATA